MYVHCTMYTVRTVKDPSGFQCDFENSQKILLLRE
jgi:hypothetical protein